MSTTDLSVLRDSRDVDQIYSDFLALRKAILPTYTNSDTSDPGNILAKVFAGIADFLHLRHDLEAAQTIPSRVERRESARAILESFGGGFTPPASAMVDLTVTITGSTLPAEDIPIDLYHAFSAPGPGLRFLVPHSGLYWPAGTRTFTIPVMHGEDRLAVVGETDGSANQFFDIGGIDNIIQNETQRTVRVTIGDVEYAVVDTFADSGPTDTHVLFRFLDGGSGRIVLGNNRTGMVPPSGEDIVVQCVSGGGSVGNVGETAISQMLTPLSLNGETFAVTVTNADAASGGTDEQSIRDAMAINPRWWRAQDRCVASGDTAALARKVPGVLDASSIRTGVTVVTTYILGQSANGYPGTELINAVDGYLEDRAIMTDDHVVAAPTFVAINVAIAARRKNRASVGITKAAIEAAVRAFFNLQLRKAAGQALFTTPGTSAGNMYTSDLIGFLEAIPAVDNLDLDLFTREIIPSLEVWTGGATISSVSISNDTHTEQITVLFLSATSFFVSGTVSGALGTGVVGTAFSVGGAVVFTISNSGAAMAAGDRATFRVSNLVGNILPAHGEIPTLGNLQVVVS